LDAEGDISQLVYHKTDKTRDIASSMKNHSFRELSNCELAETALAAANTMSLAHWLQPFETSAAPRFDDPAISALPPPPEVALSRPRGDPRNRPSYRRLSFSRTMIGTAR
jgi:hypothetical protein